MQEGCQTLKPFLNGNPLLSLLGVIHTDSGGETEEVLSCPVLYVGHVFSGVFFFFFLPFLAVALTAT